VRGLRDASETPAVKPAAVPDPNITELETSLSERLGAQVVVRHSQGGKGTLTIRYTSLDELDGILGHIK